MNPVKKDILFLAPIPPPLSGHSLVSEILFKYLSKSHRVTLINLIHNTTDKGDLTFKRLLSVLIIFGKLIKYSRNCNCIYLTISESLLGNVKDIIIFLILFNKLNKLVIHLHGGSIEKELFQKFPILKEINIFFYKRLSKVIVTGNSHKSIFAKLNKNKLFIVSNFVKEDLFIGGSIPKKFKRFNPIKVLYLSLMDIRKGYLDLLYAIEMFSKEENNMFEFNFAGNFTNEKERKFFKNIIKSNPQINYHGYVEGIKKKKLLNESHIFCLPTTYFEGQPISILESYASGCVVLTTKKPGILDIFKEKYNGYSIEEKSPRSIKRILLNIIKEKEKLEEIAINNLNIAKRNCKQDIYCQKIESLLIL